jgi:hypothetical protein
MEISDAKRTLSSGSEGVCVRKTSASQFRTNHLAKPTDQCQTGGTRQQRNEVVCLFVELDQAYGAAAGEVRGAFARVVGRIKKMPRSNDFESTRKTSSESENADR